MNIVISGGNYANKGAQAMLYIALNECIKRFPNENYILQLPEGFFKVASIDGLDSLADNLRTFSKKEKLRNMISVYKSADIMIDISGYELASKLGTYPCLRYLFKIGLSRMFGTKVYLMPQSFGPFNFEGAKKGFMMHLIKKYMKYPQVCYAREQEGADMLLKASPKAKIVRSNDLVLQNNEIEFMLEKISTNEQIANIKKPCVAVIPNNRLSEQCGKDKAFATYEKAILKLRELGYSVCLLCHSNGDMKTCQSIKEIFMDYDDVVLVDKILSCFEYQVAVRSFDFIIAGRYHSIVHAYKECVPAIALGWAVKYEELLAKFDQAQYSVNVKNDDANAIVEKIDGMAQNRKAYAEQIKTTLKDIQQENCFDIIKA